MGDLPEPRLHEQEVAMTTEPIIHGVTFHYLPPMSNRDVQRQDLQDDFHCQLFPDEPRPPALTYPVHVTLAWSSTNPYSVDITFAGGKAPRLWEVSRDLLAAGAEGIAGDPYGDVQIFPELESACCVELVISSPSGRAGFRVPRHVLTGFLEATFEQVPWCAEVMPDEWLSEVA